jgi:transposase
MDDELGDEQWELIAPLLPKPKGRGRPRAEDRRTVNGILWVLRSGARWKDLPPKYGSRSTLSPATPGVARPGSLGADAPEVAHCPGRPSQIGLEPGLSGWQLRAWQKSNCLECQGR